MKKEFTKTEEYLALEKTFKEAETKMSAARKVYHEARSKAVARFCDTFGIPVKEIRFTGEYGEIVLPLGGRLDIHYARDYNFKKWEAGINVGACGSFGKDNERLVEYYSAVGAFAANLAVFQKVIDGVDMTEMLATEHTYYDARYALENCKAALENEMHEANMAEARSLVRVGARFDVSGGTKVSDDRHCYIREVTRVTPKRVYIGVYYKGKIWTENLYKREDVESNLACGIWTPAKEEAKAA